jgi:hypothetical protein
MGTAYDTWKVAMGARGNQYKMQVRANCLQQAITSDNLPAWSFGIQNMPDYLNPLPSDLVDMMQQHAHQTPAWLSSAHAMPRKSTRQRHYLLLQKDGMYMLMTVILRWLKHA